MRNLALRAALAVVTLASICSCSTPAVTPDPSATRSKSAANKKEPALSVEEAQARAARISGVSYDLKFELQATATDFRGTAQASFESNSNDQDLSLDFADGMIEEMNFNGESLSQSAYDGYRIRLPKSRIRIGKNQLLVRFTHSFNLNGNGLYRFVDPADQRIYIYSNLEPFAANRIFPCFDQPDLKAEIGLEVIAPRAWEVIGNMPTSKVEEQAELKHWRFVKTPPTSTYLFALMAGEYTKWKSTARPAGGRTIPLALYARKSLAQYVDYAEWFEITKKGLSYFAEEFDYPYPYPKYDQIIVPDFTAGAMENPGAVTFSERMIYRTKVPSDRKRDRAETILHEMAHMWFGDLVTMKWWNGLWLNESFASFMASLASEEASPYGGVWQSFFRDMKQWGYWEDQLVTTHPIESVVPDTDQAFTHFDGITYGKGASVLKQLRFYIGEEEFRSGVQNYFKEFAFKNTTIQDFMGKLAAAAGKDLTEWQRLWLQTSGMNSLRAHWSCEKGKLTQLSLEQLGAPLRPHRTRVGLFYGSHTREFAVDYSESSTAVAQAVGKPCPNWVFPNLGDEDFVKVELDSKSMSFLKEKLASVSDPMLRQMIWHTLWESVTHAELPAQEYVALAIKSLPSETETLILSEVLKNSVSPSLNRMSALGILVGSDRAAAQEKLESMAYAELLRAKAGSDAQLVWWEAFVEVAASTRSIDLARALLAGERKLPGLTIDQEKRWDLTRIFARNNTPGVERLIEAELANDATDNGAKAAARARAMIAKPEIKREVAREIFDFTAKNPSQRTSVATLKQSMRHFHVLGSETFTRAIQEEYFSRLSELAQSDDEEYNSSLVEYFFPSLCELETAAQAEKLVAQNAQLPAPVRKELSVAEQEERRCVNARRLSQSLPRNLRPI